MSPTRLSRTWYTESGLIWLMAFWLLLLGASLVWNLSQAKHQREALAYQSARSFYELIVLIRRWNASHGGVYVPATPKTPPNPYLEDPMRDIRVNDELTLTKVNPAYMTRALSELAAEGAGVQFHITSLRPVRPENKPLDWEVEALQSFEQGNKEWAQFAAPDGRLVYRYMAPLLTEEPCLRCHRDHGYQLGDVRGGISITLPELAPIPWLGLVASHALIGAVGIGFIGLLGRRLHRTQEELRRQTVFDALTSIPNRRFFIDQLIHELQRGQGEQRPVVLLICDIDNFKGYNDTFGQEAGDRCLQALAEILDKQVGGDANLCARYGGEEFVVVLPDTSLDKAMVLAEQLRMEVFELGIWHPASPSGVLTISIGLSATAPQGETDYESLIQRAEAALARAKTRGRNRVEAWSETGVLA